VVVGGFPFVPGDSMAEKMAYLRCELDHLRRMLMLEPRGHADMFGCVLLPPANPEADIGAVFMEGDGYLDMCGHGSIGAVTVALETGLVELEEPFTEVLLDTPAGLVRAGARVEWGAVTDVTVRNVPSFLYREGVEVRPEGCDPVRVDVAFGGNFFALVKAADLGVRLEPGEAARIVEAGMRLKRAVNEAVSVRHPTVPHIRSIELVEISDEEGPGGGPPRNAVVFGDGQVDRSPCGTGTCARMAVLHARGMLAPGEEFVHESILGTRFEGRIVEETRVGPYDAVTVEITGRAYLTGLNQFLVDPRDPLGWGFRLGRAAGEAGGATDE